MRRAYLEEYQEDTAELDVFLPARQERLAEAMDDRNRLLALLAYLTPKERQVVHLQADGYTYHEIAEICNIHPTGYTAGSTASAEKYGVWMEWRCDSFMTNEKITAYASKKDTDPSDRHSQPAPASA